MTESDFLEALLKQVNQQVVCDAFLSLRKCNPPFAQSILTTLSEIELDNPQCLKILIFYCEMMNGYNAQLLCTKQLRRLIKLKPEEPQAYYNLAVVLIRMAKQYQRNQQDRLAKEKYEEAIQLLLSIVHGTWDTRFSQIEVIAVMEMNRICSLVEGTKLEHYLHTLIDKRLQGPAKVDIRVSVQWDTDQTDIELRIKLLLTLSL
eukprot:TRINITY_DN11562_c0_g1_i3.p1 TRINITY_DN11562_c0_g1~~TRINITY_DN11562_c0_g1_i3.p1  ORF type:complete len:215 (+),score=22.48 TRINITY_DN11562_c0_g1_i3:36-647(+)